MYQVGNGLKPFPTVIIQLRTTVRHWAFPSPSFFSPGKGLGEGANLFRPEHRTGSFFGRPEIFRHIV